MFNTIKKFAHTLTAAISGVDARPMRKHRGNVIALHTGKPIEDGNALANARRSLVNTLSQVLDARQNALVEKIVDLLDDGAANDDFDADALIGAFERLGIDGADDFDFDDWHALAAAVDYYSGSLTVDLQKAVKVVVSGDYRYCRNAYDHDTLGEAIYSDWLDNAGLHCLPDWLTDAIDFEIIGKDYDFCNGATGKFTSNGYFLPLDD